MRALPVKPEPAERPSQRGGRPPLSVHESRKIAPAHPRDAVLRRRRLAVAAALAVGLLLRLMQYAVERSLWLDEALLSSSVLYRDFAGLLRPLDFGQTAPLGFLFLEKLVVTLLGTGEYALRLLPLLAGVAGVLLVPAVARRYVSRPAAPLAVAVFALAPFLVYYSSEVKQYAFDALVSLVVLLAAWELARAPRPARAALFLALAGVAGVWLSQPAVFMLAGTTLALAQHAWKAGDRRRLYAAAAASLAWGASFLFSYAMSRRTLADPEYMQSFWKGGFFTTEEITWLPRQFARAFREPLGIMGADDSLLLSYAGAGAALLAFLAGCAWAARRRSLRFNLLVFPLALTLLASFVRLYPFGGSYLSSGRVLIFLIPTFGFLMAEGAVAARRRLGGTAGRAAFAGLAVLILLPSVSYAALSVPHVRAEVKPLLDYAAEQRQPGDFMYVYYNGRAVFRYYAPRYGWTEANSVVGTCARTEPVRYLGDLAQLRGRPRVWVLFVDGTGVGGYNERTLMLRFLDHIGRRLDDRVAIGTSLYLYDLREENVKPGRFPELIPTFVAEPAVQCRGPWGTK